MSAALRQRQSQSINSQGTAARVADYIREEFPVPRGQPTGLMLQKEDRRLAAIILSVSQALWFITVSVGIVYYSGTLQSWLLLWVGHTGLHNHSSFPKAVWQATMACNPDLTDRSDVATTAVSCSPGDPTGAEKHAFHSLVWFDHWLRTIGPLFPFMLLATRYRLAALAPEVLTFDQQPWVEQIVVYIGLTVTRLAIYFIHRLGKHLNFSCFLTQFLQHECPTSSSLLQKFTPAAALPSVY